MDAETKRRLKKELLKARGTRNMLEAKMLMSEDGNRIAHLSGRIYAMDAEIESLLHRLAQES